MEVLDVLLLLIFLISFTDSFNLIKALQIDTFIDLHTIEKGARGAIYLLKLIQLFKE